MDIVTETLEKYRNSPQYHIDIEMFENYARIKFERDGRIKDDQLTRFHNLTPEARYMFIHACIQKYESKEYNDKEYNMGREPRCPLYDFIFDYGQKYGKPSCYQVNEYFGEEQYDIDGKFIIANIYGQGTFTYCKEIRDDEIIPHALEDPEITIYDQNEKIICITSKILVFKDICEQIAQKNLTGYTYKVENVNKVFKI